MHFLYKSLSGSNLIQFVRKFGKAVNVPNVVVHPDVRHAQQKGHPIVALESTIITHGMPHPENVETALQVEQQVRDHGALPATIGILDGFIKVGLTKEELITLAKKPQNEVLKCSRRDLPYVMATKQSGGTTVAATMIVANQVGIKVFATGGIGGVHREGHVTMDVSADLVELGRTPVAVVCSGVKSILDIPRTLEYLETQGVCVATYDSPGGSFPDFYTQNSGSQVPYNLQSPHHAAELLRAWADLNLQSGVVIGVPIPREYAADKDKIDEAISKANSQAVAQGVTGKDVTPFMLAAIARLTKGHSLQANIALIKNNAKVAAQIASALSSSYKNSAPHSAETTAAPLVIGASILDLTFKLNEDQPDMQLDGATYKATTRQTAGGVGRNIAEGIYKLHGEVNLISAVGTDLMGKALLQLMPAALQRDLIFDDNHATSLCSVIFNKTGDLKLILGNMEIHNRITSDKLMKESHLFRDAPLVVIDSNLSKNAMTTALQQSQKYRVPVFFEPTDMIIAGKPFQLPSDLSQQIRIIKPNLHELKTIVEAITGRPVKWHPTTKMNKVQLIQQTKLLLQEIESHFNCIITTLGRHGTLLSFRPDAASDSRALLDVSRAEAPHMTRFYDAPLVANIVNDSGAGDSFCAGFITALLRHQALDECVAAGFVAAERALFSESAVPESYFPDENAFEKKTKETLPKLKQQSI